VSITSVSAALGAVVSSSTLLPVKANALAMARTDLLGPPWRSSRLGTMCAILTELVRIR
jgi:hypothetical protein